MLHGSGVVKFKDIVADKNLFLKIALFLIACYFVYFAALLVNLYATFHEYGDLGISVYGLYFNTHYPEIAHGLQLMEFDQHLSADALFIELIYYLFQSPLTILMVQLAFITLTAALILYVVRDLTKDNFLAFALCLAFLINPGTIGLNLFDSHVEFIIVPFYILTFFYYIKGRPTGLVVSLALLLGSADVAPFMALTLGVGLLAYELIYNRKKEVTKSKSSFALLIVVASLIAIFLYSAAISALASGYESDYSALPQLLHVIDNAQNRILPALSGLLSDPANKIGSVFGLYASGYRLNLVYALLLVTFGFGITLIEVPLVALVFSIPWLGGAFVIGDASFISPTTEYFGYILGSAVSATILGMLIARKRKTYLTRVLNALRLDVNKTIRTASIALPVLLSVIGPVVYLTVYSPSSTYHTINANNIARILLMAPNATEREAYAQLNWIIAQVPQNASVMTNYFIMPHVAEREHVAMFTTSQYTFTPEYLLVDFNMNISNSCVIECCSRWNPDPF